MCSSVMDSNRLTAAPATGRDASDLGRVRLLPWSTAGFGTVLAKLLPEAP